MHVPMHTQVKGGILPCLVVGKIAPVAYVADRSHALTSTGRNDLFRCLKVAAAGSQPARTDDPAEVAALAD